jgi:hypothetical protein
MGSAFWVCSLEGKMAKLLLISRRFSCSWAMRSGERSEEVLCCNWVLTRFSVITIKLNFSRVNQKIIK